MARARAEFEERITLEPPKIYRLRFDLINKSPDSDEESQESHHEDCDYNDDDDLIETPPITRSNDFSCQIQK